MDNVHPIFQEICKPFFATGLTTDQRIIIAEQISLITSANTRILETINEMDDNKKAYSLMKATEKIGSGSQELFMLIK